MRETTRRGSALVCGVPLLVAVLALGVREATRERRAAAVSPPRAQVFVPPAAFLANLLERFGGDERLALGAYYRGPAAVRKYGLGPETTRYVANVLALRQRM